MSDKHTQYTTKAAELWATMDKNQRGFIRFGIFPAEVMERAEREGYTDTHTLTCALLDCAKAER